MTGICPKCNHANMPFHEYIRLLVEQDIARCGYESNDIKDDWEICECRRTVIFDAVNINTKRTVSYDMLISPQK